LFCELPYVPFSEIRRWWTEIIREFVDGHLPRVKIEQIKSRQGAFHYVSKYCAKLDGEGEIPLSLSSTHNRTPGRWWGVFNRNHLPMAERLYAIVEIITPVGFAQCKEVLDYYSPTLYPNKYRGKVIFAPDSLALFRVLIDLLKPDMRQSFYNRYSRWTHENKQIQPVQNLLHQNKNHCWLSRVLPIERSRVRGRGLYRRVQGRVVCSSESTLLCNVRPKTNVMDGSNPAHQRLRPTLHEASMTPPCLS
jgi:hypothetical protein